MLTVSKSVLKAKMLELFRHVEQTDEELIVTSHRVPVLKVVPLHSKRPAADVFADVRGQVKIDEKDLLEPTTGEWEDV